jgi:mycoredoxin
VSETRTDGNIGQLTVYTTRWCGDCLMAKAVLDRVGVAYDEVDIENDPDAAATVQAINGGYMSVPTLVLPDGQVLVEPTRLELLSALGLD